MHLLQQAVTFLRQLIDPGQLGQIAEGLGGWFYLILFAIIFAETGLVIVPFLPGDSLLFAVGAVAATNPDRIGLGLVAVLLIVAAVLGDAVNYAVGAYVGPAIFSRETSRLLNKRHLTEAHEFYERYGGKTIILARFIPIIRTFAPFVAGIGRMTYSRFALFNVVGGVAWVSICLYGGWLFGSREFVRKNFELVLVAIVVISVLPAVVEYLRKRPARPAPDVAPILPGSNDAPGT